MDITNLALVRAMKENEFFSLIDNEGVLFPLNECVVIRETEDVGGSKVGKILDKLKSDIPIQYKEFPSYEEYLEQYGEEYMKLRGIPLNPMRYRMLKEMDEGRQEIEFLQDWIPLRFEYNSVILFSINGLVPDDIEGGAFANNTFSSDKFAVIIGLSDIIDQSGLESIVPTDTAIKGRIELPKGAYILFNQEEYERLSYERKEKIQRIMEKGIKCCGFSEKLKNAIATILKNSGKYTNENLSLSRQDNGYKESKTKGDVINAVNDVSSRYGIQKKYHFDYALLESEDYYYIYNYIENEFFRYLQEKKEISFDYDKLIDCDSDPYYIEFAEKIRKYGVEKFHLLVKRFNKSILELKRKGKIPTPKELIEANEKGQPISIVKNILELEQARED